MELWLFPLVLCGLFLAIGVFWLTPNRGDHHVAASDPVDCPPPAPLSALVAEPPATVPRQVTCPPPDIFDENRVGHDLASLADKQGVISQHLAVRRKQRYREKEIALINQWTEFYNAGTEMIKSKTELLRSRNEHVNLQCETEEKNSQKEAAIAKLQADAEEHNLRHDKAAYERQHLEGFAKGGQPLREDEQKLREAQQHRQLDARWELSESLRPLQSLIELQRWRRQQRDQILKDRSLRPEEQNEDLVFLDDLYAQKHAELKVDTRIFEEQ